jgi:putative ubiquitin-RnfH superfamily antitoxin RatB of RatAB toxin-antitoxin module
MEPRPDDCAIQVAYARPDRQWVLPLRVPPGTTVRAAVQASGLAAECPELDADCCPLGVWGRRVKDNRPVQHGDRIEIYRPLQNDPRAARRAAAARGTTLGRGS